MTSAIHTKKYYYCFVDETGQHTLGKYFVVALAMIPADQETFETIENICLGFESQSKKGRAKWAKAKKPYRLEYARLILTKPTLQDLGAQLFMVTYRETTDYDGATSDAVAKTLQAFDPLAKITVLIDGLPKTKQQKIANYLRNSNCLVHKVRSVKKDEYSPHMRIVDTLAGTGGALADPKNNDHKSISSLLKSAIDSGSVTHLK